MSERINQIITRTGDDGTTSLADGTRLPKSNARFTAMGDVDELNSHIGVLRQTLKLNDTLDAHIEQQLIQMQHHLFEIGSELAVPGAVFLSSNALIFLEQWAERIRPSLPPLKEFILPSGTRAATQSHVCRSVARRAERSLVVLNQNEPLNETVLQYINRSSDLFFMLARQLNLSAQAAETYWRGTASSDSGNTPST